MLYRAAPPNGDRDLVQGRDDLLLTSMQGDDGSAVQPDSLASLSEILAQYGIPGIQADPADRLLELATRGDQLRSRPR
jgi:hypothetical protein